MANDIKEIDCPDHGNKHQADLYCYPHPLAGMWECPVSGASDSHDHAGEDTVTEYLEYWPTGPEEPVAGHTVNYWAVCGVPVEGDN